MGTRPSRHRWSEVLYWRLSLIRLIICVVMGMSFAFMLLVKSIFCMLVIRVLRRLTISVLLHLQYRWLRESGCWLQRGHRGKSSRCKYAVDDSVEDSVEYLCFVYAFGSALYKNFNKNVFKCGQ